MTFIHTRTHTHAHTFIHLCCASISGHVALRSATVEAGETPTQGVTFPQPDCILNDIATTQRICILFKKKKKN